jgi:hypothetical protein
MFWKVDLYLKPELRVGGLDCDSKPGKLLASEGESFGNAFTVFEIREHRAFIYEGRSSDRKLGKGRSTVGVLQC